MMILFIFLSVLGVARTNTLLGSCSFQGTMCDYTVEEDSLSWNLNPHEHFISVDVNSQDSGDKAILLSPDLKLQTRSCLRLIYQITGAGWLQVLTRSEGQGFDHTMWWASSPSESWIISTIDLQNSSEPYKIVIEGGRGTAVFEVNISDKYCIECDFEESHLCGYSSQWSGNVNWYVGRGRRGREGGGGRQRGRGGGPITPALIDVPGFYMYVDSSHSLTLKEVATLVSPMSSLPMSGCLTFQYQQDHTVGHMFVVYSRDRAGQYRELWRADLPESNHVQQEVKTHMWIPVQVTLSALYPLQLVFEVSFNSPKGGRMLLDDVVFSESCSSGAELVFDPSVADCDFELSFCLYSQNSTESEVWKRVSIWPNLYREGDHTTGRGFFLLASSRFLMQSGSITKLFGPILPGKQMYCLRFFYSLRGFCKSENTLSVYVYNTSTQRRTQIWTPSDRTRNIWILVDLTIETENTTQVMFASICKGFWNGSSAALDDISLRLGACELPLGSPLSDSSHCDFEKGLCGFTQEKKRDLTEWVLIRGQTPTSSTGPKGDHTTGLGHYLYIEASLMLLGQRARLLSRPLRGSRATQCLIFFYHMRGSGTGSLRVLLRSEQKDGEMVMWERSGEQSISWLRASVTYQSDHQHRIVFEASRGPSILSDTAIDDIKFQKGPC